MKRVLHEVGKISMETSVRGFLFFFLYFLFIFVKRVLHEVGKISMETSGKFINCEDGLLIPW